jgi:hypothetical protein
VSAGGRKRCKTLGMGRERRTGDSEVRNGDSPEEQKVNEMMRKTRGAESRRGKLVAESKTGLVRERGGRNQVAGL